MMASSDLAQIGQSSGGISVVVVDGKYAAVDAVTTDAAIVSKVAVKFILLKRYASGDQLGSLQRV